MRSIFDTKLVRFPLLVPCLALITSLCMVLVLWRSQGLVDNRPDPYLFSAMGQSVARGDGFEGFGSLLHRRTPLYALFIGAVYFVFGVREIVVQLLQCVMFAGTCWLAQDIGRRLFGARAGLIAGVLCALHPSFLRYVADFHLETMLTFLFTASIWLTCRLIEAPSLRGALYFGAVSGLAALTKAVVLLYPGVFALAWLLLRRPAADAPDRNKIWLTRIGLLAGAALAMALVISPWTIRNYQVTGKFVPITTGASDAVLRGFVFSRTEFITLQKPPYTDAELEVNEELRQICAKQGAIWEADDLQTDKILNEVAKERVLSSPLAFVKKTLIGLFTFWYQMTSLKTSLAAGGMALVAWIFAVVGLRQAAREKRPAWLVLAPIVYLNVFLALLLALGRYSVPVLPCLLVLAAFGLDTLLRRRTAATA